MTSPLPPLLSFAQERGEGWLPGRGGGEVRIRYNAPVLTGKRMSDSSPNPSHWRSPLPKRIIVFYHPKVEESEALAGTMV